MEKKPPRTIRLQLTDEQRKQLLERTGEHVEAVELRLDELEERIAPRSIGTFF